MIWKRTLLVVLSLLFLTHPRTNADEPLRILLISDTHLGFKKSDEAFAAFLKEAPSLHAKLIINTGDIAEVGTAPVFGHYKSSLQALGLPVWNCIGNHDTRWTPNGKETFQMEFGPRYFSHHLAGLHWIFLDSTIEHQTQGHIDESEIKWLTKDLEKLPAEEPALVFSHHPLKWRGMSVDNGIDVLALLFHHPVAALFNGHGHRLKSMNFRGIPFIENDALFNGHYLVAEISGNTMNLFVKTLGEPELKPWMQVSLHPKLSADQDETRGFVSEDLSKINLGEIYAGLSADSRGVYAGTLGGELAAVDPSGKIRWKMALAGGMLAAPEAAGGLVFAGTKFGTLYGFNAKTGARVWERKGFGAFTAAPLLDGDTLYVGNADGNFYALSAATGQEIWHTSLGAFTEMKAVASDGKLFVGAWNQKFYSLDAKTGKILWEKQIGKAMYYSPSVPRPIVSNGIVYLAAKDHQAYALDETNGEVKWSCKMEDGFSSPILVNGELLFPETNGTLVAVNPENGKTVWSKKLEDNFYNASPAEQHGFVYLPGVEGHLFVLNLKDRTVESAIRISRGWNFGTPVIAFGKLWLGSLDGHLYSIPLK